MMYTLDWASEQLSTNKTLNSTILLQSTNNDDSVVTQHRKAHHQILAINSCHPQSKPAPTKNHTSRFDDDFIFLEFKPWSEVVGMKVISCSSASHVSLLRLDPVELLHDFGSNGSFRSICSNSVLSKSFGVSSSEHFRLRRL
mmetsp:Transcript_30607/g.72200  ORF Transcript_30607/g.72200 Transcript_30607/m.72200 type:complete len:142 (+) Transcript_30607:73-498(+)